MTNTMIERVARAICSIQHPDEDIFFRAWSGYRDQYFSEARAAIEAMREPTIPMRKVSSFEVAERDWPAMIDAALSEGE